MAEIELDRTGVAEGHAASWALEEEDHSIDLIQQFHKLRRGKRTILFATLATCVLATGVGFLLPWSYTSTTSFIPPRMAATAAPWLRRCRPAVRDGSGRSAWRYEESW